MSSTLAHPAATGSRSGAKSWPLPRPPAIRWTGVPAKLANWSKLAQAGASSTVSPGSASASAAATAASRVPLTTCGVAPRVRAKSSAASPTR